VPVISWMLDIYSADAHSVGAVIQREDMHVYVVEQVTIQPFRGTSTVVGLKFPNLPLVQSYLDTIFKIVEHC
jgi:hypothetical protein